MEYLDWEFLDWVQWPAMLVTIAAAGLVGSQSEQRRKFGFWVFLSSNVLWIIWGLYAQAYALIVLQLGLAAMNIRGSIKNST
ncbi:hypothetical protein [Halopseudomonas pelagia]|uniref:Amino acid transporter n=1 Tax=Halopseudomonas pelagia TaxID=553151 RepID=A0AA91Z6F9_9GAMM|nr:hypothetical protein [Halopseudomonas pelagia]PCC99858.1 hypothetical protein CO192_08545 [Halopseudomonas pelagia]QFY56281.1 hypothetical protein EAO82_07850 [Halopseudomonas pelagia]